MMEQVLQELLNGALGAVALAWVAAVLFSAPAAVAGGMLVVWRRSGSIVTGGLVGLPLGLAAAPAAFVCALFFPVGASAILCVMGLLWLCTRMRRGLSIVEATLCAMTVIVWIAALISFLGGANKEALKYAAGATSAIAFLLFLIGVARILWLRPASELRRPYLLPIHT